MSRERRTAVAIGVAVFLSGAVLLGVEIAASRVLAPTFGSSLYVWGSLIGIVLTGLAVGYWVGGVVADRMPTPVPARLRAHARRRARRARARDRRDGARLDRRVGSRPAARSAARGGDPLRAAQRRARLGLADRRPARGQLARAPRPHRRAPVLDLDGGKHLRHVRDGVLARARARHRSGARGRGRDARRGGARRRARRAARPRRRSFSRAPLVGAVALDRRPSRPSSRASSGASRPRTGRRSTASARSGRRGRSIRPSIGALGEQFTVRAARDTRYHRMVVVDDSDSRYLRFDSSFQSGMWLADPYRTRFLYTDYLDLGIAHRPVRAGRALHRPRRRLGAEADLARLPASSGCRSSSSTPTSSTPPIAGSSCRAIRASRSTSTTAAAGSRATTSAGT